MKYSQWFGVIACAAIAVICFMPWAFIEEKNITISGMNQAVPDFGKPGLLNIFLCIIMCFCFIVPKLWAKRTNLIIGALNIAWSIRNYLLMSVCQGGECPQKKAGIYLLVCLSLFILIMIFMPPIKIEQEQTSQ